MIVVTVIVAGLALAGIGSTEAAAETFRKLTGPQIHTRFAGMDLSDAVHWRDSFKRDGTIASQSMGKERSGTWRVDNDKLCIDLGKDSGGCYDVWVSGANVEFRREGLDGSILEGRLSKPSAASQPQKGRRP